MCRLFPLLVVAIFFPVSSTAVVADIPRNRAAHALPALLKKAYASFVDENKLSQIQIDIRGEMGHFEYPNGFWAQGNAFSASVYSENENLNFQNHFLRSNRTKEELNLIFKVIPEEELRNLRTLDFPCGKGGCE